MNKSSRPFPGGMPGVLRFEAATILFLAALLTPAGASSSCAVAGDPIHWIADFCMASLETDDEIAASDCIDKEMRRVFPDDCAAKIYYKRALCALAVARQTIVGSIENCLEDRDFKGRTVENGGVGN